MLHPGDAEIIHVLLNGFLFMGVIGMILILGLIVCGVCRAIWWIWRMLIVRPVE